MAITKLKRIAIHNYKSLRSVELFPAASDFTVLVGRNGSGKSNLADAFDFVKDTYRHGLEHAVARKGGFENIAHRKERRSRAAIKITVELTHVTRLAELFPVHGGRLVEKSTPVTLHMHHEFSLKTAGQGIRSEFAISDECLSIELISKRQEDLFGKNIVDAISIRRFRDGSVTITAEPDSKFTPGLLYDPRMSDVDDPVGFQVPATELVTSYPYLRPAAMRGVISWLQRISVFQLTPEVARSSGVPTPNPSLSSQGANLPAVVDWLQRHRSNEWASIIETMREIVPEIESIQVDYLHTRTLGLFFKERGVGRAWTTDEVSDGTIRSLAMLVACYDPRSSVLFIEEPENSLHPWIIKVIMKSLRRLSLRKPVIVTTHSPILLNSVPPEEVWVVYKKKGETGLAPLISFDPQLSEDWAEGKYKLFDYLESGFVSEAVPGDGG